MCSYSGASNSDGIAAMYHLPQNATGVPEISARCIVHASIKAGSQYDASACVALRYGR